jgi:peptide deformylase
MAEEKRRLQTAQQHVDSGLKLRDQRLLRVTDRISESLRDRSCMAIAAQQIAITLQMIQRERQRVAQTGKEAAPEQRALTPTDEARKKMRDRISRYCQCQSCDRSTQRPFRT